MRPDRRELLDTIIATGERRRLRRRLALSTVGVALVAVAVAVPLSLAGGDGDERDAVVAAGPGGTGSATTDTPATVDAEHPVHVPTTPCASDSCEPLEPGFPPEPTPPGQGDLIPPVTTATTVPRSTTSTTGCRNSHDPACGPFRWDPEPTPNREMDVTVSLDRSTVAVGEPVTITARASDADGPARICAVLDHAEVPEPACAFPACAEQERHGPWDPPAPQPGDDNETLVATYDEPGTYTVSVWAYSYAGPCASSAYDVYGDDGNTSVQVTVTG